MQVPTLLLLLDHAVNRQMLAEMLADRYETIAPVSAVASTDRFDLCILDGPAFRRLRDCCRLAVSLQILTVLQAPAIL